MDAYLVTQREGDPLDSRSLWKADSRSGAVGWWKGLDDRLRRRRADKATPVPRSRVHWILMTNPADARASGTRQAPGEPELLYGSGDKFGTVGCPAVRPLHRIAPEWEAVR